jgi:beta-lactamase superfamily II metal-dependent hydrolase
MRYFIRKCRTVAFLLTVFGWANQVDAQKIGKPFPKWKPGLVDIHHINTGKGECAFFILPDGTTLLVDAGVHERPMDRNAAKAIPNDSRQPGEWIGRYVTKVLKPLKLSKIDYVLLTHFDTDHIGGVVPGVKKSPEGDYYLTGISEVLHYVPADKIIDRAWPDYNWPKPIADTDVLNYRKFVEWQVAHKNVKAEQFQVGSTQQLSLKKQSEKYPEFEIRNIVANGVVWTGTGNGTKNHYPAVDPVSGPFPSENSSSIGFRLSYGKFDYFTGGDLIGVIGKNSPSWMDIETPVAKVVGPVDVNVLNHHGYRDAQNEFFLSTLKPRVHILQSWDSWHPAPTTLERLLSQTVYQGPREIFATNLIDSAKERLGKLAEGITPLYGHVVIRVDKGGRSYTVYILDDTNENQVVKAKYGPYESL